jgi:ELWxxDGT repeat protein
MTTLVFSADDGSNGRELWTTDGAAAGTRLLVDAWPGGGSGNPSSLTPLGDGRAVFAATDPVHNAEPWVTDGTAAGTRLVLDVNADNSGFGASYPGGFAPLGDGRALFAASDPEHGNEPWVTDGTPEGTRLLETTPGPDGSYLSGAFVALGDGRALFGMSDPDRGSELWVTDGTQGGTALVADINPGPNGSFPGAPSGAPPAMFPLGDGRAVFAAEDGEHGRELWITDGTEAGTRLVADLWEGGGSGNPGGVSYSYPPPPYGPPYGPPGGPGGPSGPSGPGGIFALGDGRALFSGTDPLRGTELWITDGTPAGTRLVEDINSNAQGFASSVPSHFAALDDGRVVFAADDGANGVEPWITDGTAEGTRLLHDINPGAAGSGASGFARVSGAPAAEVPEPSPPADGWLVA